MLFPVYVWGIGRSCTKPNLHVVDSLHQYILAKTPKQKASNPLASKGGAGNPHPLQTELPPIQIGEGGGMN